MKITIIYDNTSLKTDMKADWGFACLVEAYDRTILFDTGAKGSILLENMKKLDIDPLSIDDLVISHDHWDHVGGIQDFLKINNNIKLYIPASYTVPQDAAKEVITIKDTVKIHKNIFLTGELKDIEQSLIVSTEKGLVVIVGCSHPGIETILDAASRYGKVYALIGGLHGFNEFDLVKDLDMICATHCTQHIEEIRSLFPDKFVEGGAGQVIEI